MKDRETQNYKLTQYSHGAGCGCKISPAILDTILNSSTNSIHFPNLLVGNEERDDAAVFDLENGTAIVSTTDFFMPVVDDAFEFGQIASVNAISDIYAMGAKPLMAVAILGWPIEKIPAEIANKVIEGSRSICIKSGIPLAGGHSIDCPEPIFGLAVTGILEIQNLKKNGGAQIEDFLFLTKPLGVGIYTTAQKKGLLKVEHENIAKNSMLQLNDVGIEFGKLPYVHSMTDVTGFGLLGHLAEMCEASGCSAALNWDNIPKLEIDHLNYYLEAGCIPGGTQRNWKSYAHKIDQISDRQKHILCDPQTSGGLLVSVSQEYLSSFLEVCSANHLQLNSIGRIITKRNKCIYVV
ncbi:MAG: selenide, water dikinase SelD [Saprospiraceae bacterium]|nr:selenide, water dikinase SelD [Saprospiraceae bacterium]